MVLRPEAQTQLSADVTGSRGSSKFGGGIDDSGDSTWRFDGSKSRWCSLCLRMRHRIAGYCHAAVARAASASFILSVHGHELKVGGGISF